MTKQLFLRCLLLMLFYSNVNVFTVKAQPVDTGFINHELELAKKIIYIYPDSSSQLIDSIIAKSLNISYTKGIFKGYNLKGSLFLIQGQADKAKVEYQKASKFIDESKRPRDLVVNLSNLGLVYRMQYKLDSAEIYFKKSIEKAVENNLGELHRKLLGSLGQIYEFKKDYVNAYKNYMETINFSISSKDSVALATTYLSLGLLYQELEKYQQSVLYFHKSFALDNKVPSINLKAKLCINLGEVYSDIGNNDSAIYYYRKAIEVALPYEKDNIELSAMVNLGNIFLDNKSIDSSLHYYNIAFQSPLSSNLPNIQTALLINMGNCYLMMKDYERARALLVPGYEASLKYDLLQYKRNALKFLIQLDSTQGRYKEALSNYFVYMNVVDSLNAEKASSQIASLEFDKMLAMQKYDNRALLQENKMKNELITTQQRIMMIIVIALVLLLIFFYVVVLNRKKVRKLANELIVQNDKLTEAKISLENNQHELEAQQKDLRELNKSKDKFLSILSHDLKGPISGFNELLTTVDEQWGELPDEEKHHLTKLLKDSSGRTFVLLEDLLNWGKATNGQIKPELKIFNVKEVSLDVVKLFESKLSKKNIQLNLDIPDDFQLNNDARLFSHIIQNLINNAIKYTFPGGKIAIKAELIKGMKTICVSLNGIGIPKNIVPKLFNLDVNFNRRGTENEKSSGMGLILCKEYANLMNVKITIESKENEGSKFCIVC